MQHPNNTVSDLFVNLGLAHIDASRARSAAKAEAAQTERELAAVARLGQLLAAERRRSAALEAELRAVTERAIRAETAISRYADAVRAATTKKARRG
jgi:hypothetical protein